MRFYESPLKCGPKKSWQGRFEPSKNVDLFCPCLFARAHFFCCCVGGAEPTPAPGSSVCSWLSQRTTLPPSSCVHTRLPVTHLSSMISSSVARFLGSISNILPTICLLSRGSSRRSRHGPLITCDACWLLVVEVVGFCSPLAACSLLGCRDAGSDWEPDARWSSPAVGAESEGGLEGPAICLGPSFGGDTKSLYELSDTRGAFHGNRRSVIQQKMMARDQMSVG